MKVIKIFNMKKVNARLLFILPVFAISLSSCSTPKVKRAQALQILGMIKYEQEQIDFSRGNTVSLVYEAPENVGSNKDYSIELHEDNRVIRVVSSEIEDPLGNLHPEFWLYVEEDKYYEVSYTNGIPTRQLICVNDKEDEDRVDTQFSNDFNAYRSMIRKTTYLYDRPQEMIDLIKGYDGLTNKEVKESYRTKRNGNISISLTRLDNKEELYNIVCNFDEYKLVKYSKTENTGENTGTYTFDYSITLKRPDSFGDL